MVKVFRGKVNIVSVYGRTTENAFITAFLAVDPWQLLLRQAEQQNRRVRRSLS